eukprot:scaffold19102_cov172-Amphora_coffeaeformis.AAC.4
MGNRLSPNTEKSTESGTSKCGTLAYSASAMQGRRSQMEDAHLAIPDLFHDQNDPKLDGHSLFAVFDGHGGSSAAKFAARNIARILLEHKSTEKYMNLIRNPQQQMGESEGTRKAAAALRIAKKALLKEILEDTFVEIDRQFLLAQMESQKQVIDESNGKKSARSFKDPGTTALAVLVTPDLVVCANAGDCRAMLIQDDAAGAALPSPNNKASPSKSPNFVELSEDHRPENKAEERRIKKAGGYVFGGRLEDDLAVSRGFGDYRYKDEHITVHGTCPKNKKTPHDQKVSPHPEIKFHSRKSSHKFLFLGCDGVFEQMKSEKVVRVLSHSLEHSGQDLAEACTTLLDKSLRKGSKDNMTALVVDLYKVQAAIEPSESLDSSTEVSNPQ